MTEDNGKEFAYHEKIAEALGAQMYCANPYSSWQRGLNKNTNELLRQHWPKSTDYKKVLQKALSSTVVQLNMRPRKTLGYQTLAILMDNHIATLVV